MNARKKLILYGTCFLLLLAGFFYFVFRGTDEWKARLPVLSYVQPFSMINQSGDTVTQASLTGKVYVAHYFFVSCTGICPNMNNKVKTVYEAFRDRTDFAMLSHTCHPEEDSIGVLKRYADSIGADGRQWQFLTGDKLQLYRMARESYHIDDPKNNVGDINDQFLHSQFLALVDRRGQVRGIYDGLRQKEVDMLKEDIEGLLKDQSRTGFVNNLFGNTPAQ